MPVREVKAGTTSNFVYFRPYDTSTSGLKTGIAAASWTIKSTRNGVASVTETTPTAGSEGTFSANTIVETSMAGVYQYCPPDARFTAGASAVSFDAAVTGCVIAPVIIQLTGQASGIPANNANSLVDSTTGTNVVTLPSTAPTGWIVAASIAASALNGKGDWLTGLGTNAPAGWLNAAAFSAGALNGKGDWLLATSYTAPDNTGISNIYAIVNHATYGNAMLARRADLPDNFSTLSLSIGQRVGTSNLATGDIPTAAANGTAAASAILVTPLNKLDTTAGGKVTPADVDGLTYAKVVQWLIAAASGAKMSSVDNNDGTVSVTMKAQDGTTSIGSFTYNKTSGDVTAASHV